MKSWITKFATLSLIGGAIASPLFVSARSAVALTEKEVTGKLGPVFVYTISTIDEKNKQVFPITAEVEQDKKKFNLAFVFFSSKDAADFLAKQKAGVAELKKTNPKEAEQIAKIYDKAIVAPESLATFYEAAIKANSDLRLEFVPMAQQVQNAQKLEPQFRGVPLFRVDFGQSRYSTAFFFSKEDLDNELTQLKKSDPKLAASTKVEVVPLDGVIEVLRRENIGYVKQIELIAPLESRQLLQGFIKQQQEAEKAKGAKPAPKK
ncbi:MAG: hypothetical protein RLZZ511_2158 [Cyanobacteriota bacterium]|jgi:Tic22-like family